LFSELLIGLDIPMAVAHHAPLISAAFDIPARSTIRANPAVCRIALRQLNFDGDYKTACMGLGGADKSEASAEAVELRPPE
jgi:hypothetical protein